MQHSQGDWHSLLLLLTLHLLLLLHLLLFHGSQGDRSISSQSSAQSSSASDSQTTRQHSRSEWSQDMYTNLAWQNLPNTTFFPPPTSAPLLLLLLLSLLLPLLLLLLLLSLSSCPCSSSSSSSYSLPPPAPSALPLSLFLLTFLPPTYIVHLRVSVLSISFLLPPPLSSLPPGFPTLPLPGLRPPGLPDLSAMGLPPIPPPFPPFPAASSIYPFASRIGSLVRKVGVHDLETLNTMQGNTAGPPEMAHSLFLRESELPQVGFKPTSLYSLDQCSVH